MRSESRMNQNIDQDRTEQDRSLDVATLGGGCFWCLEAVYEELEGVVDVVSGYAGGDVVNPTYKQVCTGNTGHAEVVQVTFDRNMITYLEVLQVFFSIHDPTTLNRQGADVGTQYRSVIFYHNDSQRETAEALIESLAYKGEWRNPIVTEVEPLDAFYPAEDYHQAYYENHKSQPYCRAVINPKLKKFRKKFKPSLKVTAPS
jgi:peptide-methionine (S)-S-oxide reductase